jgi:CheY-like chemotaxis protein
MNFNSLFFMLRRSATVRAGSLRTRPSLTVGLLPHFFFRGINATIEVYIQYTDSIAKVLEFLPRIDMREKILVIEDDEVMRELMRMTLEKNGYEVATAEDGVRGYDAALFLKPDLIVTDIQMPGADGIHVVRRVRDTTSLETTPILVTTAFGTGTGTFSLQIGANAFEPKPINSHSFLSTVRRLLADRDTRKAA